MNVYPTTPTDRSTLLIIAPREARSFSAGTEIEAIAGTVWVTEGSRDAMVRRGNSYCSQEPSGTIVVSNPLGRPATVRITPGRGCR